MAKKVNPAVTVVVDAAADAAMVIVAAVFYGAAHAGRARADGRARPVAGQAVSWTRRSRAASRATIQASAFARSDTTLQLAWVIGGFVGIAMPLNPRLGLSVAGIVLVAWTVFVLGTLPRKGRATPVVPTTPG